jgi:hypothetical protein
MEGLARTVDPLHGKKLTSLYTVLLFIGLWLPQNPRLTGSALIRPTMRPSDLTSDGVTMKHTLYATLTMITSLATAGLGAPLLDETFDGTDVLTRWTHEGASSIEADLVTRGNDTPSNLCITATNGAWRGPMVALTPFEYYRIAFTAKANSKCYWLINYYRTDGTEHPVDHYNCFEASTDWAPREYFFRCIADVTNARVAFRPMTGQAWIDDVVISVAKREDVLAWAKQVYAAMPPLTYTPPTNRWTQIPKTMESLRAGKILKVVMLGDSIVNDTGNSAYDVRIESHYPGARWKIIQSVRGSTGCAAYKEGNRIKEMVLDYTPDLLMIGGISNGDAESVRTVIHQIREKMPNLEIFVMSGPIGRVNPFTHPEWTSEPMPADYRAQLAQVAADENCEFLDMETIWGNYIKNSGKTWEYFTRDELHGNSEGRQVLSKILEAYFAPKGE